LDRPDCIRNNIPHHTEYCSILQLIRAFFPALLDGLILPALENPQAPNT
jgi:hypothetical protein